MTLRMNVPHGWCSECLVTLDNAGLLVVEDRGGCNTTGVCCMTMAKEVVAVMVMAQGLSKAAMVEGRGCGERLW